MWSKLPVTPFAWRSTKKLIFTNAYNFTENVLSLRVDAWLVAGLPTLTPNLGLSDWPFTCILQYHGTKQYQVRTRVLEYVHVLVHVYVLCNIYIAIAIHTYIHTCMYVHVRVPWYTCTSTEYTCTPEYCVVWNKCRNVGHLWEASWPREFEATTVDTVVFHHAGWYEFRMGVICGAEGEKVS